MRPSSLVGLFVLAGMLGLAAVVGFYSLNQQNTVEVPLIRGMQIEEAWSELAALDLTLGSPEELHHDSIPAGYVVAQDPEPGHSVKRGRHVRVTVSLGPRQLAVPVLTSLRRRDAESRLASLGLQPGNTVAVHERTLPPETILASEPPPGTQLAVGEKVHLLVSRGPELRFPMPDLLDRPFADVRTLLAELGLDLTALTVEHRPELPHNTILRQQPASGSMVERGTPVSFLLATSNVRGPKPGVGDFQVVRYTVPHDLELVPVRVVSSYAGQSTVLVEGSFAGGTSIGLPVLSRPGTSLTVFLRGSRVWERTVTALGSIE